MQPPPPPQPQALEPLIKADRERRTRNARDRDDKPRTAVFGRSEEPAFKVMRESVHGGTIPNIPAGTGIRVYFANAWHDASFQRMVETKRRIPFFEVTQTVNTTSGKAVARRTRFTQFTT